VRTPLAGWMRPPIALLVAIAGAVFGAPAVASALAAADAGPAPVAIIAPAPGELVSGDPVLQWTASGTAGYELRWNVDGTRDGTGALDHTSDGGGRLFPGGESFQLTGLTAPTYHWQVRALPDGAWSPVGTFHLDIQLDTLGPGAEPGAETPAPEAPAEEPTPEAGAGFDAGAALQSFAWVAGASSFAGLLLAVVGREWLRLRRERES